MVSNSFFKVIKLLRKTYHQSEPYNLFKVLRSESDEVRLHSRFLTSILNPKEAHNYNNAFLNLFLKQLGLSHFNTEQVQVIPEYKNIDIFIKNNQNQALIIENKIYAGDQENQLSRYYSEIKKEGVENITIIYLTLHGNEPEQHSIENIPLEFINSNKFHCISYKQDIKSWIDKCI